MNLRQIIFIRHIWIFTFIIIAFSIEIKNKKNLDCCCILMVFFFSIGHLNGLRFCFLSLPNDALSTYHVLYHDHVLIWLISIKFLSSNFVSYSIKFHFTKTIHLVQKLLHATNIRI